MANKLAHFRKVVAAAGTAEALTSSLSAPSVIIQAETDNTGVIYVGDSTVSATNCASALAAGNSVEFGIADLASGNSGWRIGDIFIDSSVSGDGVFVGYPIKA